MRVTAKFKVVSKICSLILNLVCGGFGTPSTSMPRSPKPPLMVLDGSAPLQEVFSSFGSKLKHWYLCILGPKGSDMSR